MQQDIIGQQGKPGNTAEEYSHSLNKLVSTKRKVQQSRKAAFFPVKASTRLHTVEEGAFALPLKEASIAHTEHSKTPKAEEPTSKAEIGSPVEVREKLQIFVRGLLLPKTLCLNLDPETSVSALKKVLKNESGIQAQHQHLYIGRNFQLCDLLSIRDHGIQQDQNIELRAGGLLGGGPFEDERTRSAYFSELSVKIGRGWKRLARQLGFSEGKIDQFEEDNRGNLHEQIFKMLDAWWKKQDNLADAPNKLRDALREVDRADFASQVHVQEVPIVTDVTRLNIKDSAMTTILWTAMSAIISSHGLDYLLEQFSAWLEPYGIQVVKVKSGSVTFVVRIMSRAGLNNLWSMYKTGELAKKLTEIFITDKLITEDKSGLAIQATILESDYEQACRSFDELERDQQKVGEDGQAAEASTSTQQHDRSDGEDGQAAEASTSTQQQDRSEIKAAQAKQIKAAQAKQLFGALEKAVMEATQEMTEISKGSTSMTDFEAKLRETSTKQLKQQKAVVSGLKAQDKRLSDKGFEGLVKTFEGLTKFTEAALDEREPEAKVKHLEATLDDAKATLDATLEDPAVLDKLDKSLFSDARDREVFQEAMKKGSANVHRTRLMIVGQERVGKTSLMRSLIHESFNSNELSTEGVTTDCTIDITYVAAQLWKRKTGDSTSLTRELMVGLDTESYKHIGLKQWMQLREQTSSAASQTKMTETQSGGTTVDSAPGEKHLLRSSKYIDKAMSNRGNADKNRDTPTLKIWDFAGQDLYYTTHQTFLSSRAIYLVVFNLCQDLDTPVPVPKKGSSDSVPYRTTPLEYLDFWMQSIFTYTKENFSQKELKQNSPPIFIVGTHRNSVGGDDLPEDQRKPLIRDIFDRIREEIKDKPYYPHVVSKFYSIENSLEDNEKIQELRMHIEDVAVEEPYMGEKIPLNWMTFDDEKGRISGGKPVMTLKQVMKDFGIKSKTKLLTMLKFYHDLGHIIYFGGEGDKKSQALRDVVILDPQWLIDAFKQILTVKPPKEQTAKYRKSWDRLNDKGILEDLLIDNMWQNILEHKQALLALMDKFDLLCERVDEPREEEKSSTASSTATQPCPANASYYVPSMLRERTSRSRQHQTTEKKSNVFYVDFNEFLPDGLYHRLVVRALRWSQKLGGRNPRLLYDQANFYVDDHHEFALQMVHQSNLEYVKVSVTRVEVYPPPRHVNAPSGEVTSKVKDFVEQNLQNLKTMWIERINYCISVKCPHKKVIHFLPLDECMAKPEVVCHFEESHVVVKTDEIQAMFKQERSEEEASPQDDRQPMTDIHFRKIVEDLGIGWEQLATSLGFTSDQVGKIKTNFNTSGINEQIFQMLVQWRQKRGKEVDKLRKELIDALIDVGKTGLANKVENY